MSKKNSKKRRSKQKNVAAQNARKRQVTKKQSSLRYLWLGVLIIVVISAFIFWHNNDSKVANNSYSKAPLYSQQNNKLNYKKSHEYKLSEPEKQFVAKPPMSVKADGRLDNDAFRAIKEFQENIGEYKEIEALRKYVIEAEKALEEIKNIIETAVKELPADYSIDLVLQQHRPPLSSPHYFTSNDPQIIQQRLLARKSQAAVKYLLDTMPRSVIGAEGKYSDNETFDDYLNYQYGLTPDSIAAGRTLPDNFVNYMKTVWIHYDGVVLYLSNHPRVPVIGIEVKAIQDLLMHTLVYSQSISRNSDEFLFVQRLAVLLLELRNEIAVAKTINKLKEMNKMDGVIVFGFVHARSFLELIDRLGLASDIYWTLKFDLKYLPSLDFLGRQLPFP